MNIVNAKQALQAEVSQRIRYLVSDCSTFTRVRCERHEWYEGNKASLTEREPGLGGGNFLMALGLFAALNFAAKVHAHLTEPRQFFGQKHRFWVKAWQKQLREKFSNGVSVDEEILKELQENEGYRRPDNEKVSLKKALEMWTLPRLGVHRNEQQAFVALIKAVTEAKIDLGFSAAEAKGIWQDFRNDLAHIAQPGGCVNVYASVAKQPSLMDAIERSGPSFVKDADRWRCNVDRLWIDMLHIGDWLSNEIQASPHEERVCALHVWMFGSESEPSHYDLNATTTTTTAIEEVAIYGEVRSRTREPQE